MKKRIDQETWEYATVDYSATIESDLMKWIIK